ncbi:alkane 1-monooxygenase [Cryptosporangium phraense]|uniref:Alkane 1-monooxygenase n=1 Tax=Cryptosporangium phraense TaxID=2593070 RepID=A0A545ALT7_9ACTN|nr:alkane 1-monooxygenase [Cryptosporangium phraense]TQS42266.1 alkane 1-monooxygenase [Cryptosporangium phraense]
MTTSWRDGRRYLWPSAIVVPILPFLSYGIVSQTGVQGWWWLTPLLVFVVIPLVDMIGGDDVGNPPEDAAGGLQADRYYRWLTFLYLPLQFGGLVLGSWQWVDGGLGWAGKLGVLVSVGTVNGIAINAAHELGHKRESLERWLSKIALAPTAYGHFYVEHNRGHHTRVATPEDPASSRLGEGFWRFWPRTVWGSLVSAWRLESSRLALRRRSRWTWRNDVLNAWAMTLVLFVGLALWFGPGVLPFLAAQAVLGFSFLEVVNYLEHYGLKRSHNGTRYERVDEQHSWNSNRLVTNMFLYQLQRHSDHHANPVRRYQILRTYDTSPQLPAGYATMIVVALFPPLWRRIMDPKVIAHYGGDLDRANLHEPARASLEARGELVLE